MADRIDALFADWHRLGGAVLLAERPPPAPLPEPERLIAESTASCRHSSRLMWVVLDWMTHNASQLDPERLIDLTQRLGDVSVLGLLCDMVLEQRDDPVLSCVRQACEPSPRMEIFFHRVARSPLAAELARRESLEIYRRWGYVGRELVRLSASSAAADGLDIPLGDTDG